MGTVTSGRLTKCPKCSWPLDAEVVFCPACGRDLRRLEAEKPPRQMGVHPFVIVFLGFALALVIVLTRDCW